MEDKKKGTGNRYASVCCILASMTSIVLGYDIGVMSGAAIYIQRDLKLSEVQVEIMVGIINIYSLLGSGLAGRTSDWIGRRYTIVLAGGFFFAGAILMGFSPNYAFLMFARFIAGIGIGYAMMIAPVYTTEISPPSSRGFLTSFPEVFINIGILFGYISNYGFSKLSLKLGWRLMLGIGAFPSLILALGVLTMPETPRWLMMKGRLGDAKKVLYKTSDTEEEAQSRLKEIKAAAGIPESCNDDIVPINKNKQSNEKGVWKELFLKPTPTVRHIIIAVLGLNFFQQASGIDAVVLYSPIIFRKAGIQSDTQQLIATVAVGIVKTLSVLVATFFTDRFGRRPLLLSSVGGMVISLLLLSTSLTVTDQSHEKLMWAIILSIISVLCYVATFSMGAGPVTWVYSSEILPLRLRATGVAAGIVLNRVTSGVVSMTFLSLSSKITIGGAFFFYAGLAICAWIFFYTLLPETQGKTLEELEGSFGNFSAKSKNKGTNEGPNE